MEGDRPISGDVLIVTATRASSGCLRRSPDMRSRAFEQLVTRIKSEFVEMPGLSLTLEQSSRLWGLKRAECEAVLHVLVHRKFLSVRADGKYRRATDADAHDRRRVARTSRTSDTATARSAGTPADRQAGARSSLD